MINKINKKLRYERIIKYYPSLIEMLDAVKVKEAEAIKLDSVDGLDKDCLDEFLKRDEVETEPEIVEYRLRYAYKKKEYDLIEDDKFYWLLDKKVYENKSDLECQCGETINLNKTT